MPSQTTLHLLSRALEAVRDLQGCPWVGEKRSGGEENHACDAVRWSTADGVGGRGKDSKGARKHKTGAGGSKCSSSPTRMSVSRSPNRISASRLGSVGSAQLGNNANSNCQPRLQEDTRSSSGSSRGNEALIREYQEAILRGRQAVKAAKSEAAELKQRLAREEASVGRLSLALDEARADQRRAGYVRRGGATTLEAIFLCHNHKWLVIFFCSKPTYTGLTRLPIARHARMYVFIEIM